ncbi:hypothetical protein [Microvirga flavescens]|uniref:hypothetical protein n=1 Tax=Microvirga flavescens TaxID=2249811 RepID=UPI0013002AE6|nr:hypothetical protein [Microvirga flavescens]
MVRFIEAESAQDWPQIAMLWPRLEAVSQPSSEVIATIRLLARYDLLPLGGALRNLRQAIVAMQVIGLVSMEQRFKLALISENSFVEFAAVFLSVYRQPTGFMLSEEMADHVTGLMCKVA